MRLVSPPDPSHVQREAGGETSVGHSCVHHCHAHAVIEEVGAGVPFHVLEPLLLRYVCVCVCVIVSVMTSCL